MGLSKYLAFASAVLAGSVSAQEGKVAVLTTANFDDFVKEHADGALVEFYAPWCGHCKKLEPEFDQAAKDLHADGVKTPLAKVDATVESSLGTRFGVQGYPTLKYFVGGEPDEYDGPREAKGIVTWIKSMGGPALSEGEPDEKDDLSVTLYGSADDKEKFESVAKSNRKKAKWYFVEGSEKKLVLKHLGEDAIETTETDDAAKFFKDNGFPMFGELNGETFSKYVESGKGLIWMLFDMDKDNVKEKVDENRALAKAVSAEAKEDYSVTWTKTHEFAKVLESMFGITEFPKVVVQKKAGGKQNFIYDGEMTEAGIKEYLSKIKSGELKPHLKSEEAPTEPQETPVKVYVGNTMEARLFNAEKDVLFEVYAPWCGHCKKLDPEYIKVGKKVTKEGLDDILEIAKMDGTVNDSPVDSVEWSGFPTIVYVKAGSKEVIKYDGARDAKGIWKWIKKNHSKKDQIKDIIAKNKGAKEEKKEEEKKEEL